jgi:hypothetical protein
MSSFKTVSGDYTITVDGGTGTLTINADLDVVGNVTYIESNELKIDDPFITVAANNTGTINEMGLIAQRSATTFAGLRFDDVTLKWQISSDVTASGDAISPYVDLSTGTASAAGANTQIQFNNAGSFAANANLTYDFTSSKLTLQGHQALGNIGSTPSSVSNSVVIYNKAVGSGGTGLYVKSSSVDDELVSKSAAIVFSIIF